MKLQALRSLYHIIMAKKVISKLLKMYKLKFTKYSAAADKDFGNRILRRNIIINSHVIEKGLTHDDFRPGFGKTCVKNIYENITLYKHVQEYDRFAVENAEELLRVYHSKNVANGFDDSDYLPSLSQTTNGKNYDSIIITTHNVDKFPQNAIDDFESIAKARHSVRYYGEDAIDISDDIIEKVIRLSQTAPSACNRQATHIFVVKDRKKFENIEKLQLGCRTFGKNASAFFFITSDLSLYDCSEVKLPIFDVGLYTMNMLYALQTYGLYSCVLNASFPGEANNQIHEVAKIPENYDINGLIAVYQLPEGKKIRVPLSPRRDVSEIAHILE